MNKLDYNHPPSLIIGTKYPNSFRISASSVSQFINHKPAWFREKVLNLDEGFKSSTSSVLGTTLHFASQCYSTYGSINEADKQEMYNYITEQAQLNPEIDEQYIRANLTPMWQALRTFLQSNPTTVAEPFCELPLTQSITAGGSIDGLYSTVPGATKENILNGSVPCIIRDYKTTGSLSAPTTFSICYCYQLVTYAYVLRKHCLNPVGIELVYITHNQVGRISEKTGKPMKDYPSTVTTLAEPLHEQDFDFIRSILDLIADSVQLFRDRPDLRYIIASDPRLRNNTTNLSGVSTQQEI